MLFSGPSATEQVQQVYGGTAEYAYGALGGSGHWEFNPGEMDAIIKKWEALRDDTEADRRKIDAVLSAALAPSKDQPTTEYTRRVTEGVGSMAESNHSMLVYIQDYLERLKAAKKKLEDADAQNADALGASEA